MFNPILQNKINDFEDLIKKIDGSNDKKRKLWLEIYTNAITDREIAHSLLQQLLQITDSSSSELAVHGKTITTYLERISKANDQLIKLADIISKYDITVSGINTDSVYDRING